MKARCGVVVAGLLALGALAATANAAATPIRVSADQAFMETTGVMNIGVCSAPVEMRKDDRSARRNDRQIERWWDIWQRIWENRQRGRGSPNLPPGWRDPFDPGTDPGTDPGSDPGSDPLPPE
jgi:hypothetical protein